MARASGAHVMLGGVEFELGEQFGGPSSLIRPHYLHLFNSIFAPAAISIPGKPGSQNLEPDNMFFAFTDWSGGEGNPIYDSTDTVTFDNGLCNPRNPGYVTAPPTRTDATVDSALTATIDTRGFLTNSAGAVWVAGNHDTAGSKLRFLRYSTDGSTWTAQSTGASNPEQITAMTSDIKFVYLATIDSSTDTRRIWQVKNGGTNQFSSNETNSVQHKGLVKQGKTLYGWTGTRLFSYDTTGTLPVASTKVYDTGIDFDAATPFPSGYFAGAVATDDAVVMFLGDNAGFSEVYLYDGVAGTAIWGQTGLAGYTTRAIGWFAGSVYLAGTFEGQAALWRLDLASRTPIFVGYFRENSGTTLSPMTVSPGTGSQLLITMKEGYVFIYDVARDAISELDQRTTLTTLYGAITYKNNRIAVWGDNPNHAVKSSKWGMDRAGSLGNGTDNTFTVTHGVWNFDLPSEINNKILRGVYMVSTPLTASVTLQFKYDIDETGSYTSLPALTSGTGNWQNISTASGGTKKGSMLRYQVVGTAPTGTAAPKLYSVVASVYLWSYVQEFELVVRLSDGSQGQSQNRSRRDTAAKKRDALLKMMTDRNVVAYIDAYRYERWGKGAASVDVVIQDVQDIIQHKGEGGCRLVLRILDPTL